MKRSKHFISAASIGRSVLAALAVFGLISAPATAVGQGAFDASGFEQSGDVFGGINFGGLTNAREEPVTWNAEYFADGDQGRLDIEAVVGRSWHIYSTTQPPGGPLATKFTIKSPSSASIRGRFEPNDPPTKSVSDIYPGVTIEEHEGTVRWSAPIKIAAGYQGPINVDVKALVCQNGGSCMPANETLTATYAGPASAAPSQAESQTRDADQAVAETSIASVLADPAALPTTFRDDDYDVTWTAGVSSSIAAGRTGQLIFRASPEPQFHVYQGVVDDSESSTNFVIVEKSGLRIGRPETAQPIVSKSLFPSIPGLPETPPVKFYHGEVTWSLRVQVPPGTAAGDHEIRGLICYQACTDKSCLQPMALEFVATVRVGDQNNTTLKPIAIKSAKYRTAIDQAAEIDWVDDLNATSTPVTDEPTSDRQPDNASPDAGERPARDAESATGPTQTAQQQPASTSAAQSDQAAVSAATTNETIPKASLPFILLLALCGGFILNFMPCVLPVIGIKVLSFVKQAGEDRRQVVLLNFAYVAGILSVFALLTVLAVVFSFGWGQQFGYFPVRIGLTVIIFALALSYLGVWELPTPGVATGKTSDELQKKEGLAGAFFTGAFATILATPCSGPFLGVALGYTLYLSSIESAAVIMTVGLGMSLPYLVLGLFPSAVGFLPKPGNWMVTLKEFLAFLFLGTVAYFFNQFSDEQKLPVFVTLIGVWFGCWIIGKVPPWESLTKRFRGWVIGAASAAAIGWLAFAYLEDQPATSTAGDVYITDDHIRWEKYDEQRLQNHLTDGRTVMLDFTAAWCPNCITNTIIALDTEPTSRALDKIDGVAMLADMTDLPEDIVTKLEKEFGSKSIPLLAIYPGKTPEKPIVLRDIVTQSMVLEALEQAGGGVNTSASSGNAISGKTRSADSVTAAERLTSTSAPQSTSNH